MTTQKKRQLEERGILVLERPDEKKEMEFELSFLSSLTLQERFSLMMAKSQELKMNLIKNGHREASSIIKRK